MPGKALCLLADLTMTHHVLRALRQVPADRYVVATDASSAPHLEPVAHCEGFDVFAGPSDDVLARYCAAARHYRTDTVVRATGDNPLVSPRLAREILDLHRARQADLSHFLGCPLGTGVEVLRVQALEQAERESRDPFEREHLATYLYRHPDRFTVLEEDCPEDCRLPGVEVSVDGPQDYERVQEIFAALYDGQPIETDRLVAWLRSRGG